MVVIILQVEQKTEEPTSAIAIDVAAAEEEIEKKSVIDAERQV